MGLTQKKGNIGLVKILSHLTEEDIAVSLPISESEKYDLIAEKNNICKTVQVRYAKMVKGSIPVKLRSQWTNGDGFQAKNRQKGDYDIIAIYCPDTNKTYYVGDEEFDSGSAIYLRIDEPLRNKSRCKMAEGYSDIHRFFE